MNMKPKRLCKRSGCTELTAHGYCEAHADTENLRKKQYETRRPDWHTWYNSARWQMLREKMLFAHPLCAECLKDGRLTTTMVVHHKIAHKGDPKLFFDWSNLESLCKPCHDKHTAREDGGFGNKIK